MWSLGQAAKQVSVSKSTLQRDIKNGKISASKENGQYQIDPSELFRVYPKKQPLKQDVGQYGADLETGPERLNWTAERAILEAEIASLKRDVSRLEEQAADLKEDRDQWRGQAKTALLQIEHHSKTARRGWLSRFFINPK